MPRFVRRHENGNIEIFSFTGVAMVGRSRRNQVSLDDQSVSSTHAKIELADGAWTLYDLESRNGTRINEAETKTGKLKGGDQVRFGKILVAFELDDAEPAKGGTNPPEVAKPAAAALEMGAAPAAPNYGHTMAPFGAPAVVVKAAAEMKVEKPAAKAPEKPVAAAPPAQKPAGFDGGARVRPDQSELKIRVLKDQIRALQNQRLILMSIAAGLALTTVIFLIAFLMQRNRALTAEHGMRPAGEAQR